MADAVLAPRSARGAFFDSFAKPGTWFAPMWAIGVGAVAGGATFAPLDLVRVLAAMLLAGPLLCAFSQIVNDWFDREVDAINEPARASAARFAPRAVLLAACGCAVAALLLAAALGPRVAAIAGLGLVLALAYSVPPLRLKAHDGWLAGAACAFAYEGCAWVAGAAAFGRVTTGTLVLATLFSLGAHGLMTLNDFKSLEGDRRMGLRSIPATLGPRGALVAAFVCIDLFQALAIVYVALQRAPVAAGVMALLVAVQLPMQRRLARNPRGLAPWYCASAIPPFCWAMLTAAIAARLGGW